MGFDGQQCTKTISKDPIELTVRGGKYIPEAGSRGRGLSVDIGSLVPVMADRD